MSDDWMTVVNKKKDRRGKKPQNRYITEAQAFKLQKDLDITGLAPVLLSTESRNLQEDGWSFDRILKNDEESGPIDEPEGTDEIEYYWLPIPNRWNDKALFSRQKN